MIREVEDTRPKYADMLRLLADRLENADRQPMAVFVQIYWHDEDVNLCDRYEPGFNILSAIGTLEILKANMVNSATVHPSTE